MRPRIVPLVLALVMVVTMIVPAAASEPAAPAPQGPVSPAAIYRGVSTAVKFDVSPPLRDITPLQGKPEAPREIPERATGLEGPFGPQDADAAAQTAAGAPNIPAPIASFNGPANLSGVQPPDPNGDVGPNHVVVMSNLSFAVYNKTGTLLYGPALNNTLWAGFGGDCETDNDGDPIVLYDQLSDRWMLSQFTASGPTYFNCVALSTTADPTGTYYRWAFSTGANFPDYPKYGFWPDALYISTREFAGSSFAGVGAYAVNRAQLIAGNPAPTVISFLATPASAGGAYNIGDGLLPTDMDGFTLPPAGTPNFFVGTMDNGGPYGAPQDAITLWKFTADFTVPANSTFVLANTLPVAAFDSVFPCTPGSRDCIPQPGTAQKVDILSYRQRPLHRLAYRNFGTHQSLVTNQSVEGATAMAGVRWYEIRSPNSSPVIYQQGTYVPGSSDGIHRWMASAAMDSAGNLAIGYSVSDGVSTFPGVRYTGRLASDPLGTLPQGEGVIVTGTGSQTSGARWGDYTSLSVDPTDDCTFWHVNEWLPVSGGNWTLRIGAFRFNECGTADFTLGATPSSLDVCKPANAVYTVNVGSVSGFSNPVTLSATGNPAGTTTGFVPNPVTPPGASTFTIGSTGAAADGSYSVAINGTASGGTPKSVNVGLNLFSAAPAAPALIAPANGATGVSTTPTFQWSAVAGATSYNIQVATDAGFVNIVASASGIAGTSWTPGAALNSSTTYYWHVSSSNVCGAGAYGAAFSFTTQSEVGECPSGTTAIIMMSADVPKAIADNTTVSSVLNIPGSGAIVDISVIGIDIVHTWDSDLDTYLIAPNATQVELFTDVGSSGDNFTNTNLNDSAPTPIASGTAPFTGWYSPEGPLAAVFGSDVQGTWTLQITDDAGGDTGTLNAWGLKACVAGGGGAPNIDVSPLSLASTQPPDVQTVQTLTIANTGTGNLNWNIFEDASAAPRLVDWSDNFDSYATGSQMHGQGGWKGWFNDPAAGALTSSVQAHSAPNSVDILGASDLVHEYSGYTSGQWVYTAWQYAPTAMTGISYFILLNQYDDAGANLNWSAQVEFDAANKLVTNTGVSGGTLPLVQDQWVELRVEIDLDADTQAFYYDNQLLYQGTWSGEVSGGGALNIAAVDLFANSASSVYYDDMSLVAAGGGPSTCDAPSDIPWLSVSPTGGTTPPAGTAPVAATFDSTGLAPGTYNANLCIDSNDPDPGPGNGTDLVIVPVALTVVPGTINAVDDSVISYGWHVYVDVLANDFGAPPLQVQSVTQPAHGRTINYLSRVLYIPARGYKGPDGFTYMLQDGNGNTDMATVNVMVY